MLHRGVNLSLERLKQIKLLNELIVVFVKSCCLFNNFPAFFAFSGPILDYFSAIFAFSGPILNDFLVIFRVFRTYFGSAYSAMCHF